MFCQTDHYCTTAIRSYPQLPWAGRLLTAEEVRHYQRDLAQFAHLLAQPIARAPPEPPSPMTTLKMGTRKPNISRRLTAMASPCGHHTIRLGYPSACVYKGTLTSSQHLPAALTPKLSAQLCCLCDLRKDLQRLRLIVLVVARRPCGFAADNQGGPRDC